MLVNSNTTVYHKIIDKHEEKWIRYNYQNTFCQGGKGSSTNKGYENANDINVRIYYDNNNLDIKNFSIGDIIACENIDLDIISQIDLKNYNSYNITSINNNITANPKHVHLGGK